MKKRGPPETGGPKSKEGHGSTFATIGGHERADVSADLGGGSVRPATRLVKAVRSALAHSRVEHNQEKHRASD